MIVVKHRYIPGRGPRSGGKVVAIGKALAHMKYIQHRPGPDREKGGRELFNERDNVDAREMREAIKELGGNRVVVHKLTLAPEINPADKKAFTREVMKNLSKEKGLDLEWFGTEHNNTDHHHIHVVVLGKDRNGTDVRIDMKDIDKVKEYGDRYLERWHPRELERARRERESRERDGREERTKAREMAREERVRDGLELPWMHKKIVREQLEPYRQSRATPERNDDLPEKAIKIEKPYAQDRIEAAGREWSKANDLAELRELNEYLWDNYDERLPKNEYKKLAEWIRDKEQNKAEPESKAPTEKEKPRSDEITYQGDKYTKQDPYEKLIGLTAKARENEDRIPFDDYQKLRVWIEQADRAKWAGALEQQLELTHKKFERSKTMEDLKAAEGGRVLSPEMQEMMSNPIVGLFMAEAAIANEIVRSIPLDDRLRDPLKEGRDDLEAGKKGIDERDRERNSRPKSGQTLDQLLGIKGAEDKDRENRERIEKAIEENKKAKERELREQKRKRDEPERDDWDRFDPWGRG